MARENYVENIVETRSGIHPSILKRETCMHEKVNTSVKSLSLKAKKRNVYARESQHVS